MALMSAIKSVLPARVTASLKASRNTAHFWFERLFAVDLATFRSAVTALGVEPGQVLYVRSSYDDMRSITAKPMEIVRTLCEIVGDSGTIAMPTYPMTGLSQDYLDAHPWFDWHRTASQSGLLTELFRRLPGTERSLNPTHPLAARGPRAAWLVEGHERCETPFGAGSPFEKLIEADARVLSLGRFGHMTLRHLADDRIKHRLPFDLYNDRPMTVRLVGKDRRERTMVTRAHNPHVAIDSRIVLRRLRAEGLMRTATVGRTPLSLVALRPYLEAYERYYEQGLFRHTLRP
jgi:aminoglycoside 3-N-acetyltransferase